MARENRDLQDRLERRGRKPFGGRLCRAVLSAYPALLIAFSPATASDNTATGFTIEAGSLERALHALSERFSINILAASGDLANLRVERARLSRDATTALKHLLAGSGLEFVRIDANTFAVIKARNAEPGSAAAVALETPDKPDTPEPIPLPPGFEEIVVTGTRSGSGPAHDAMAPVDTLPGFMLSAQPSEELIDILATMLPGFTAPRRPLSDGQIFVRPAALRGLSPDHLLVFINGKRRHRSAFLDSSGAQAPELSKIPQLAIGRIEVLRDGASAQYGSDAIAGVINIILDEETGTRAFGQFDQYYAGDGELYRAGVKSGWRVGESGFLSVTMEYFDQTITSRSVQRPDAVAFQRAHPEIDLPNPVQNWGQPERDGYTLAFNSSIELGPAARLYAFGTFGESDGLSDLNWRNPDTVSAYDHSPAFPDFDLRDVYPAGFTPTLTQQDRDIALTAGLKGSLADSRLGWDVSLSLGENRIDYSLAESINASLGPNSPTRFYLGRLGQQEFNSNVDLTYPLYLAALPEPLTIAVGAERRTQTYIVGAGDPASYQVGPGATDGLPSGSDGFPGYSDTQAGTFDQTSYAAYVDVEVPVTPWWRLGFAARYEDYSLFGSTLDGKLSTRIELTPHLALRGTVSGGFRAPTPGQFFSERTSKSLDVEDLGLVTSGRFSPDGPVATIISDRPGVTIAPLKPEKARNINIGLTYSSGRLSGSIDFYRVSVRDRFGLSESFDLTDTERSTLAALGVPGAQGINNVSFFQNDFDTVTRGIDIALAYRTPFMTGNLTLNATYNLNDTTVTGGSLSSDPVARQLFEDATPGRKAVITAEYSHKAFELTLRGRLIGPWADQADDSDDGSTRVQTFGAEVFFDVAVSYRVSDHMLVRLGAENIFNEYPDRAIFQRNRGLLYSRNTPYETDGGFYYLRTEFSF